MILALAGGVGGAKLAVGLAMSCSPDDLLIAVNTGDDFVHIGLNISPDLDTVMYWLAGINDVERGWGVAGETWNFMAALERLGGPTWFKLGDRDLATHVERTRRLARGDTLSEVTKTFCEQLHIRHPIVPMTDGQLQTFVNTSEGELEFQEYFVRRRCEPRLIAVHFRKTNALPSQSFDAVLQRNELDAIIICPSNPVLSIEPILAVEGVRARIDRHLSPVIAVSPLVGGRAVKGPAAKIFGELKIEPTALGVARYYKDLIDGIVIDEVDFSLKPQIENLGIRVQVAQTIMKNRDDHLRLASDALTFAASFRENWHA